MSETNSATSANVLPADWAEHLDDYRERLLKLADARMEPLLRGQYSPEDILQETYTLVLKRPELITAFEDPEAPLYFRLRAQLTASLIRIARAHLQTKKRNIALEGNLSVFCSDDNSTVSSLHAFDQLSAAVSTPRSALDRVEQQRLVRECVREMDKDDRSILTLRHFDGCSIDECMSILGLTRKEYNARYIKALRHLKRKLSFQSVFRDEH